MFAMICVSIISIMGNIIQFFMNKKSTDVKNLNLELGYIKGVLKAQGEAYDIEKKIQENQISKLQNQIDDQKKILNYNKEEIVKLQRIVNRLIGDGCHNGNCPQRSPYTTEEINEITKNRKNGKNNIIN